MPRPPARSRGIPWTRPTIAPPRMATSPSPSAATTPTSLRSAATATAPLPAASPATNRCAAAPRRPLTMRVRIGCEFTYELPGPMAMLFIVRPRERDLHRLLDETRRIEPEVPIHDFVDAFGNHIWRLTAPAGELRLRYDALAAVPPTPDPICAHLPATPVDELPDDTLVYTLPSRYCPSDLMTDDAARLFGAVPDGGSRVQAICDWTHAHITYQAGSTSATSGLEAYQQRRGVCRDFAHIGILFCRALNIPARYVCG